MIILIIFIKKLLWDTKLLIAGLIIFNKNIDY